jgi:hypothetical protein
MDLLSKALELVVACIHKTRQRFGWPPNPQTAILATCQSWGKGEDSATSVSLRECVVILGIGRVRREKQNLWHVCFLSSHSSMHMQRVAHPINCQARPRQFLCPATFFCSWRWAARQTSTSFLFLAIPLPASKSVFSMRLLGTNHNDSIYIWRTGCQTPSVHVN